MAQQLSRLNPIIHSKSVTNDLNSWVHDPPREVPEEMLPSEPSLHVLSIFVLAECCMSEIKKYRRGEPTNSQYGMELFRRALLQRDPLAWEILQQCFSETVLRWMQSHPLRAAACRFDSEENYVAQAFSRFWQATVRNQTIEFRTLAAALRYLRASLNAAILDTLRAYARPREVCLPESGEPGEPVVEDQEDGDELWEVIHSLIPNERERRVAYLLYHCGLKPREVLRFCSGEFSEIQEIYRLRRNIVERLLRNTDYIRWQLKKT